MPDSTRSESDHLLLFSVAAGGSSDSCEALCAASDLRQQVEHHFVEHRDHLYLYLLACGALPADTDDLMQDTFIRLFWHLRTGIAATCFDLRRIFRGETVPKSVDEGGETYAL